MSRSAANIAPSRTARWLVLGTVGAFFVIPIIAMVEFTLRDGQGYSLLHWFELVHAAIDNDRAYRPLTAGLAASLILVVATVAIVNLLLVPTMLIVRLRTPQYARALEIICMLPISLPAIVLVVGLAPVYSVIAKLFGSGAWPLAFAYGITTLPYAYRAIASHMNMVDVRTLAEASRSLGANWLHTFWKVLLPNLRRGVLTASVLATAIVLGEYTIAALLGRTVLQTALVEVQQADAFASVIVSLLALAFAFVLLIIIGGLDQGPRRGRKKSS